MSYTAGARVRSTVTFVPESGSTSLVNVTATLTDAAGNRTALTPVDGGGVNIYRADFTIPDDAISGPFVVRWECSSPKIVVEVSDFSVASEALNP